MTAQDEWLRELDELRERGERIQRESERTRDDVLALLEIPEKGAVSIEFDDSGLMSSMSIDPELRRDLSPEQLVEQINRELVRMSNLFGGGPTAVAGDDSTILDRLADAMTAGTLPEPALSSNDFGTVTVTALWGTVTAVACTSSWVSSTPDALISDEVVRIARIAAINTDALGRFSQEGE